MNYKYQANPVVVEAFEIVDAGPVQNDGNEHYQHLALRNGENFIAPSEMLARYIPVAGDYVVRQSDGYEYINPKAVFERKYSPLS